MENAQTKFLQGEGARDDARAALAASITSSRRISRYHIRKGLGRSATGWVFACFDPLLDRGVAVKVVDPNLPASLLESILKRFRLEVKVLGTLCHPGIVAVYDAGLTDDIPYLVTELCDGPSLQGLLQRKPRVSLELATRFMVLVTRALDYVHEKRVIHRNIIPSNLILHQKSSIKLNDFGLARSDDMLRITAPGQVMGTPAYLSPEQARGLPLDGRSDLFSLGVVLYEALAGQTPWEGDPADLIRQIMSEPVPPIGTFCPELGGALDSFFTRALAKSREERFQSGAEFCESLEQAAASIRRRQSARARAERRAIARVASPEGGRASVSGPPPQTERSSRPKKARGATASAGNARSRQGEKKKQGPRASARSSSLELLLPQVQQRHSICRRSGHFGARKEFSCGGTDRQRVMRKKSPPPKAPASARLGPRLVAWMSQYASGLLGILFFLGVAWLVLKSM